MFEKGIVSVVIEKVHKNMYLVRNVYRDTAFGTYRLNHYGGWVWGGGGGGICEKNKCYKIQLDTVSGVPREEVWEGGFKPPLEIPKF
jgi:hypothetical protein